MGTDVRPSSGVATDFRLGVSGRTVSQGNPYQKLKSPRISATFFELATKQHLKIFYLIFISISAPKSGGVDTPGFQKWGCRDTPDTPGGDAPGDNSTATVIGPPGL